MSVDERLARSLTEVEGLFAGDDVPPFRARRGPRGGVVAAAAAAVVIIAAAIGVALLRAGGSSPPVATEPSPVSTTAEAVVTTTSPEPVQPMPMRPPGWAPFDEASETANTFTLQNVTAMDILYVDAEGRTGLAQWMLGSPAPTVVGTADETATQADFLVVPGDPSGSLEYWAVPPANVAVWVTDEPDPGTLWVGAPGTATPVATGVTGWALGVPRGYEGNVVGVDLAWTSRPGGADETRLYTARLSAGPGEPPVVTDRGVVHDRAELVAFGNWGYVLNIPALPEHRRWAVSVGGEAAVQDLVVSQILYPDGTINTTLPAETLGTVGSLQLVLRPTLPAYTAATDGLSPADLGLPEDVDGRWFVPPRADSDTWPAEAIVRFYYNTTTSSGEPWEVAMRPVLIADAAQLHTYQVTWGEIMVTTPVDGGLELDVIYGPSAPYETTFVAGAEEFLEYDFHVQWIFAGDGGLIFAPYRVADAYVPFDLGRVLAVGFR